MHDIRMCSSDATAQQSPDSGEKLIQIKRLDQIIVGAGIQSLHTIRCRIARSNNQYGCIAAMFAVMTQYIESLLFRQAKVEQDQVVHLVIDRQFRAVSIA